MPNDMSQSIQKLNSGADTRSVWDSIDRPIRPLVYQLNRIGLRTMFSCCGFTYDGEEEPKSHHRDTYVAFQGPELADLREVTIFFHVASLAKSVGWWVTLLSGSSAVTQQEWVVSFTPSALLWDKNHDGTSLHEYEGRITAITNLEAVLKRIQSAPWVNEVVDGNLSRTNLYQDWLIKPKKAVPMSELTI